MKFKDKLKLQKKLAVLLILMASILYAFNMSGESMDWSVFACATLFMLLGIFYFWRANIIEKNNKQIRISTISKKFFFITYLIGLVLSGITAYLNSQNSGVITGVSVIVAGIIFGALGVWGKKIGAIE